MLSVYHTGADSRRDSHSPRKSWVQGATDRNWLAALRTRLPKTRVSSDNNLSQDSLSDEVDESSNFIQQDESLPAVEAPRVGRSSSVISETAIAHASTKKIDDNVWFNQGNKNHVTKGDCLLVYPDSNLRFVWDMIGFVLILFQALYVPYSLCFNIDTSDEMFIAESIMDCFFMADIILNFNTGYYSKGNLVMSRRRITVNYLRGWFWLDLLASFPYTWVLPQQEGDETSIYRTPQLLRILRILKFLKVLRLIRVLKLKRLLIKFEDHIQLSSASIAMLELIKLLFAILFLAHWIACFWFFIGTNSSDETYYNWVTDHDLQDAGPWSQYVAAMYWSFTTMTTVGYGDIKPITNDEKLFAIFGMFVACGVFAIAIGSLGAIFGRLYERDMIFRQRMQSVTRYLNSKKIPKDIQFVVRRYVEYVWEKKERFSVSEEERVLNMLSPALRLRLKLLSTKNIFEPFRMFEPLNSFMKTSLSMQLIEEVFAPGDIICKQGDYGDTLYFLQGGNVGVINSERFLAKIVPGSYFGEISFFSSMPRMATIVSLEFTEVYTLRKQVFLNIISSKKKTAKKYRQVSSEVRHRNFESLDIVCFICELPGHVAGMCTESADLDRSSLREYKCNQRQSTCNDEMNSEETIELSAKKEKGTDAERRTPNSRGKFFKWWPFRRGDRKVSNSTEKTQASSTWNQDSEVNELSSTRVPLNHSSKEINEDDEGTGHSMETLRLPSRDRKGTSFQRQSNTVHPAQFDRLERESGQMERVPTNHGDLDR